LNVVQIDIPPLRERRSDITVLAHHFLGRYARENDRVIDGFSDEALRAVASHSWPGNVRELQNAIERAVVMGEGRQIELNDLPAVASNGKSAWGSFVPGTKFDELERMAISETLEACSGSTSEAAEMLGISRRKIQYRLKEWGLSAEEVAAGALRDRE